MTKEYTIDANGKVLGRIAGEVASILLGKKSVDAKKENVYNCKVSVINASGVKVTGKKMKTSVHKRYSGYPSGLKLPTLEDVVKKKGYRELILHAVEGMLPKNKLQKKRLQNLIVTE